MSSGHVFIEAAERFFVSRLKILWLFLYFCHCGDLGHLKQGRRVMVHPLRVPELSNPKVLETIQQESCEEIKLHFVRPQGNPEDWSGLVEFAGLASLAGDVPSFVEQE